MTARTKQQLQKQTDKINALKNLADSPTQQMTYALKLLETEHNVLTVEAALSVLVENIEPVGRPTLLNLYQYYDADGPKRDLGGGVRSLILKVLAEIAEPADISLMERAVSTLEFAPPNRDEVATGLRSAALIALARNDPNLASFYAVRLLEDKFTSPMSGQPAITAVRILAAQHNYLPLYQYVVQPGDKMSDVLTECIRNLIGLPETLLQLLINDYRQTTNDGVLIALFDLILAHRSTAVFTDFIVIFLTTSRNFEVYRYLTLAILTSGNKNLITKLLELADQEKDAHKLIILVEVLELSGQNDPRSKALLKKLK